MNEPKSQSFNVDDIRRIRDENYLRYKSLNLTPEEISKEISQGAKAGYEILERIKREKATRQGA